MGQTAEKGRSEVDRKFPHLPVRSPAEVRAWGPGRPGGWPPSSGPSKAGLPQVSRAQTFARQPYSQGMQEPLEARGQGACY